jgi:hypothetical protein
MAAMAQRRSQPEQLLGVREMLETVLQLLDQADLHLVAVHVDMALVALGREQTCWSMGYVGTDFS